MIHVLVRDATSEDAARLRELERQSDLAAHWSESDYVALFAQDAPARCVLVASAGTGLQGFAVARCSPDQWEIENVVVSVDARRQGIATGLMRGLLSRARAAAVTSVLLEVRESNLAARRLYEGLGFSIQGRRKGYYRQPDEDALLLCFLVANL